jgi:hypothetical protein
VTAPLSGAQDSSLIHHPSNTSIRDPRRSGNIASISDLASAATPANGSVAGERYKDSTLPDTLHAKAGTHLDTATPHFPQPTRREPLAGLSWLQPTGSALFGSGTTAPMGARSSVSFDQSPDMAALIATKPGTTPAQTHGTDMASAALRHFGFSPLTTTPALADAATSNLAKHSFHATSQGRQVHGGSQASNIPRQSDATTKSCVLLENSHGSSIARRAGAMPQVGDVPNISKGSSITRHLDRALQCDMVPRSSPDHDITSPSRLAEQVSNKASSSSPTRHVTRPSRPEQQQSEDPGMSTAPLSPAGQNRWTTSTFRGVPSHDRFTHLSDKECMDLQRGVLFPEIGDTHVPAPLSGEPLAAPAASWEHPVVDDVSTLRLARTAERSNAGAESSVASGDSVPKAPEPRCIWQPRPKPTDTRIPARGDISSPLLHTAARAVVEARKTFVCARSPSPAAAPHDALDGKVVIRPALQASGSHATARAPDSEWIGDAISVESGPTSGVAAPVGTRSSAPPAMPSDADMGLARDKREAAADSGRTHHETLSDTFAVAVSATSPSARPSGSRGSSCPQAPIPPELSYEVLSPDPPLDLINGAEGLDTPSTTHGRGMSSPSAAPFIFAAQSSSGMSSVGTASIADQIAIASPGTAAVEPSGSTLPLSASPPLVVMASDSPKAALSAGEGDKLVLSGKHPPTPASTTSDTGQLGLPRGESPTAASNAVRPGLFPCELPIAISASKGPQPGPIATSASKGPQPGLGTEEAPMSKAARHTDNLSSRVGAKGLEEACSVPSLSAADLASPAISSVLRPLPEHSTRRPQSPSAVVLPERSAQLPQSPYSPSALCPPLASTPGLNGVSGLCLARDTADGAVLADGLLPAAAHMPDHLANGTVKSTASLFAVDAGTQDALPADSVDARLARKVLKRSEESGRSSDSLPGAPAGVCIGASRPVYGHPEAPTDVSGNQGGGAHDLPDNAARFFLSGDSASTAHSFPEVLSEHSQEGGRATAATHSFLAAPTGPFVEDVATESNEGRVPDPWQDLTPSPLYLKDPVAKIVSPPLADQNIDRPSTAPSLQTSTRPYARPASKPPIPRPASLTTVVPHKLTAPHAEAVARLADAARADDAPTKEASKEKTPMRVCTHVNRTLSPEHGTPVMFDGIAERSSPYSCISDQYASQPPSGAGTPAASWRKGRGHPHIAAPFEKVVFGSPESPSGMYGGRESGLPDPVMGSPMSDMTLTDLDSSMCGTNSVAEVRCVKMLCVHNISQRYAQRYADSKETWGGVVGMHRPLM